MRKNYISKEYRYENINGFNYSGIENSIFINTIPFLPEFINIKDEDIIYYENKNGEQFDSVNDYGLDSHMINTSIIKEKYSSLTKFLNNQYILKIDILNLFINYVFGKVKESKMFINLSKERCINSNVNITIKKYIQESIFKSFDISDISFYISYFDAAEGDNLLNNNVFNKNIYSVENKIKNFSTNFDVVSNILEISFRTTKPLEQYSFNYYYDISFQNLNR